MAGYLSMHYILLNSQKTEYPKFNSMTGLLLTVGLQHSLNTGKYTVHPLRTGKYILSGKYTEHSVSTTGKYTEHSVSTTGKYTVHSLRTGK